MIGICAHRPKRTSQNRKLRPPSAGASDDGTAQPDQGQLSIRSASMRRFRTITAPARSLPCWTCPGCTPSWRHTIPRSADHSAFSRARNERFREAIFSDAFERVVETCIAAGLVRGEGFAVDASLIVADANKQRSIPGKDWDKRRDPAPHRPSRGKSWFAAHGNRLLQQNRH